MNGTWGGFQKGAVKGILVELLIGRCSPQNVLPRTADANAASSLASYNRKINRIAAPMYQQLPQDQEQDMSRHNHLTAIMVNFCDPHSPWQRHACENTHDRIRPYLPAESQRPTRL